MGNNKNAASQKLQKPQMPSARACARSNTKENQTTQQRADLRRRWNSVQQSHAGKQHQHQQLRQHHQAHHRAPTPDRTQSQGMPNKRQAFHTGLASAAKHMPPQFVSKAAATHSSATNPGHSHGSSSVSPSGASLRLLACTPPLSFAFFVRAGSAYVFFFCLSQIALPLSFFPSLSELALHTFFFSACRKSPFPSPSFLLSFFL